MRRCLRLFMFGICLSLPPGIHTDAPGQWALLPGARHTCKQTEKAQLYWDSQPGTHLAAPIVGLCRRHPVLTAAA